MYILNAHQCRALTSTYLQINNYPACTITKSYFCQRSAHASIYGGLDGGKPDSELRAIFAIE